MLQDLSCGAPRPVSFNPDGSPAGDARVVSQPLRPLTVLIVDDERLLRWSIRQGLLLRGHRVVEADSAATALAAVAGDDAFDVILLDCRLPDRCDLSLLAAIIRVAPHAAVFMMTAYREPGMCERALELGARAVIDKPFQISDLVSLIEG
jgi:DNA-binding NtrC family response regulator